MVLWCYGNAWPHPTNNILQLLKGLKIQFIQFPNINICLCHVSELHRNGKSPSFTLFGVMAVC